MKVGDHFHLTYCSNIHRGESWDEVCAQLTSSLPRIRELLGFEGPLGVGLRLSALAADALAEPSTLSRFRAFLHDGDYYVFTINGFPYGAFHGTRVKERVYLPDWRDEARVAYANRLAHLLADLLAERSDIVGSVSTVPGAFRSDVTTEADVAGMASGILRHAAELVRIREETGITITLAIEPEPACYLETVEDAIAFFRTRLFDHDLVQATGRTLGASLTVDDVRRHVGLCLDACHMAVEFEDPSEAFERLRSAGVGVFKIQISSAIEMPRTDAASFRAALSPFAEDTYLHQVVERSGASLRRYTDLPDALAAAEGAATDARDWRVHFHVPIFLQATSGLGTTQCYLSSLLQLLKREPICPYLEVETYTWDVLPPEYRNVDVCTAIARELRWARVELGS